MRFERILFVAGVGLFAWLLHRVGLSTLARGLGRIGWGFAPVLALEGVSLVLATLGWRATLPRLRRLPFRPLLRMRLAGDAINSVAPVAVVGGEMVRAKLLASFVRSGDAFASVALAAFAQFLGQVLFVGLGSVLFPAERFVLRQRLIGGVLLASFAIAVAIFYRPRRGGSGMGPSRRLRAWLESFARPIAHRWTALAELREGLTSALGQGRRGLPPSILYFFLGWIIGGIEVLLILTFLGRAVSPRSAFSIAVLMVGVEGALFFVPARAGVAEGGLYAIFALLGLNPADGFCLAIVRRLRELTWAAVGLTLLALSRRRDSEAFQRAAEGP